MPARSVVETTTLYVPLTVTDGDVQVHVPPASEVAAVVVAPACQVPPFQYLPVGSCSETCTELAPAIPDVVSLALPDHAVGYAVVAP